MLDRVEARRGLWYKAGRGSDQEEDLAMVEMTPSERSAMSEVVAIALREDLGSGDVTSESVLSASATARGGIVSRVPGVVAGLPVVREVFRQISERIVFQPRIEEGSCVQAGARLAEVSGPAVAILAGERVALNFLQRLSGIATLARRCVESLGGYDCRILDTRKTTPCLRALEKYAVRVGGGCNHRMGLYDQVLIKDNHLRLLAGEAGDLCAAVRLAVERARRRVGATMLIEVEVETLDMVDAAIEVGADVIMLDNMSEPDMREAVRRIRRCRTESGRPYPISEASGGITIERLESVAATGVDTISLGALTHSVRSLDMALEMT